jgi:hypothetical protein
MTTSIRAGTSSAESNGQANQASFAHSDRVMLSEGETTAQLNLSTDRLASDLFKGKHTYATEPTDGGALTTEVIHALAAVDSAPSSGTPLALSHDCGSEITDYSTEQSVFHANNASTV